MKRALKWIGIFIGVLVLLLVIAMIALMIWKPWAPSFDVAEPGDGGQRITEDGLLANYYPAEANSPAILVLGGSEGGLSGGTDAIAQTLNDEGFTTMALSYYGAADQPQIMENLPLEYFDTALSWLSEQPEVNPDAVGIFGGSKGAEAALLIASRDTSIKATVAAAPSHVVWAGIDMAKPWAMAKLGSTWSADGEPLPYVPYGGQPSSREIADMYRASLVAAPDAEEKAVIPVENSAGPVLMTCGEDDTLWPACDMARKVEARAKEHGGPEVTVLAYPDAGHLVQGPPAKPNSDHYNNLDILGGSIESNQAGLEDSWPQVVEFFHAELG
ncbi:acyl-CoA thioester hydrolase/BAAT C-terminal domain-containing protein [Corynebacterium breve]|uniref:Acyl-CoA thioester hydrolase/BAAT C-terminal domain-containing protein n=1 Tax=Corynebacterium breve TaxID=3049799 RepID=A0ABY8VHH7_9CORY|nr:acyl-CoA thioester hydrolase/BAAT C-terminal domain-containing protein [Corynebacterium breve]WIM68522.1 acyl-CoA thioester hydrolase/BAAT C-terminal domain-containing protein [Corynebacterium breve]